MLRCGAGDVTELFTGDKADLWDTTTRGSATVSGAAGLMECPRLGNPNSSSMFVRPDSVDGWFLSPVV